ICYVRFFVGFIVDRIRVLSSIYIDKMCGQLYVQIPDPPYIPTYVPAKMWSYTRDFKPSSILLDSQMNANLFDFSVVREGPKAELIIGQWPLAHNTCKNNLECMRWVCCYARLGLSNLEVDSRLHRSYYKKSKQKMFSIVDKCLVKNQKLRPTMREVLDMVYDALKLAPRLLDVYFSIALHEVNQWGGASHKDVAEKLLESLELLMYENLSSRYASKVYTCINIRCGMMGGSGCFSRLGVGNSVLGSSSTTVRRSSQLSLLCFVVTAIAKIATHHRELLPRTRVSLGKATQKPGTNNWSKGKTKMIANIPFYILAGQEGAPHHDFSWMDIFPGKSTSYEI
nr:hypothetical protein [Tanacetum cinerariifolium]